MTTIQVAILFPVVLMWLMLIVQYGLWWHSKQIVNAAAAEAVAVTQVPTGTEHDGTDAAQRFVDQSGNLTNVAISVSRETDVVVAEVSGHAPQLVPFYSWSVTARSYAPTERFIPEAER